METKPHQAPTTAYDDVTIFFIELKTYTLLIAQGYIHGLLPFFPFFISPCSIALALFRIDGLGVSG